MTKRHKLDADEWELVKRQWPNDEATSAAEAGALATSERELVGKKQFERQVMGDRPVVVIKGNATQDFRDVLAAGTAAGNGTDSQRAMLRKYIEISEATRERHQKEQLKLSSNSRYVVARDGHHSIQLSEPELIVTELRTMLEHLSREVLIQSKC